MVSRRGFFTEFGRSLVAGLAPALRAGDSADPKPPPRSWLRPPGALAEPDFLDKCTRCTDCLIACPHQAIRRLGPEFGDDFGTPAVIPLETPCYLCEDLPCVNACETGALRCETRCDVDMGLAVLARGKCYLAQGQPCDYCIERCPLKSEAIVLGDDGLPRIDPQGCTGCGVCAYLCPADALTIVPRGQCT